MFYFYQSPVILASMTWFFCTVWDCLLRFRRNKQHLSSEIYKVTNKKAQRLNKHSQGFFTWEWDSCFWHGRWNRVSTSLCLASAGNVRSRRLICFQFNVCSRPTDDTQAARKHSVYRSACHLKKLLPWRWICKWKASEQWGSTLSARKWTSTFSWSPFLASFVSQ